MPSGFNGFHLHSIPSSSSTFDSIMNEEESTSDPHVQICQHQVLSYEKFHKIANLPNIRQLNWLEAFAHLPQHRDAAKIFRVIGMKLFGDGTDQDQVRRFQIRRCPVKSDEEGVYFLGDARFVYDAPNEHGQSGGFVLFVRWYLSLSRFLLKSMDSKKTLTKRLDRSGIKLCSHMRLSDPKVVEASWKILHPSKDPAEKYEAKVAKQNNDFNVECKHCESGTEIKYERSWTLPTLCFETSRFLGEGQSAKDPAWRAQCGL
ncbi:hypothetical protein ACLMJK_006142 [Lecanora helva]